MNLRANSIQRQVIIFALVTCLVIMIPLGGGLFLYQYKHSRTQLIDSIGATSRITAVNVSAALAFNDQKSATEILAALDNDPLINSATIFDQRGEAFAQFKRPATDKFESHKTIIDITYDGNLYGQLEINGGVNRELNRTTIAWISVYLAAIGVAALSVYLIARRFQKIIAAPIVNLATTALRFTHERDYKTRAPVEGCIEVNDLARAINAMLAEIERRDARLASQVETLNREVTDRKAAEKALRDNQNAMIRLSREAGMSEVAVGVLHNIGNILTSINVSNDLITQKLTHTRRRHLTTLNNLLDPKTRRTAAIFTSHADGPELQSLLIGITHGITTDLEDGFNLLEMMQKGISHLKNIVSSQQSLARPTRMNERFALRDALQDAITLTRTICRPAPPLSACPDNPAPVYADRSMVVQILLNLLINAQEAITTHAPPTPHIGLHIESTDEHFVTLTVTDNGVGIASDKLVSIFTYGYTTKPNGHGFGLHNSANAARVMGGELTVTSPGLGQGATFTLRLPTDSLRPTIT